jgi:hypothetical protein
VPPRRWNSRFLEHAKQLRLDGRRHLTNFVEKQHATVCLLDPSRFGGHRAGEGAALVPEQLRIRAADPAGQRS